MSYKLDRVSTSNYNSRPGNREPIGICLHHWGVDGQSHDGVARYLASHRPANPTSAHDVISAGRVTEVVDWDERAWHGRSANDEWIGLECRPEMSQGDLDTLVERCADIERHYGKSMRYGKHSDFVATACPGRYANRIQELINAVNALHIKRGDTQLAKTGKATPKKKNTAASSTPSSSSGKSIATMASEVIAGRHGSGHANRRRSLGISAAQYENVRAEVNRRAGASTPKASSGGSSKSVAQMASEVIAGHHGTGHTNRRRSLGVSQSVYDQVRAEVNRRARGGAARPAGKSISQMATEVIQGKHGNGHANRQKSLGVNNATYAKVRAEVNRRS